MYIICIYVYTYNYHPLCTIIISALLLSAPSAETSPFQPGPPAAGRMGSARAWVETQISTSVRSRKTKWHLLIFHIVLISFPAVEMDKRWQKHDKYVILRRQGRGGWRCNQFNSGDPKTMSKPLQGSSLRDPLTREDRTVVDSPSQTCGSSIFSQVLILKNDCLFWLHPIAMDDWQK